LGVNWNLGARSALSFNYAHEVTPSDEVNANAQTSDRFTANFNYAITPRISSHLEGIFTKADISQSFINTSNSNANNSNSVAYDENQYAVDTGFTFHYNNYLDFDAGVTISGVNGGSLYNDDYSRDQTYLGVRGTY
jgi:hypothetical protein